MDLLDEFEKPPVLASLRVRFVAFMIDMLILFVAGYIVAILFNQQFSASDGSYGFELHGTAALVFCITCIALIPIKEGITGQTFGKQVCKIKVVYENASGNHVKRPMLLRHLLDVVDIGLFCIGFFLIAFGKKKQRLGDIVAGTLVIVL